jgi:hypothetical protein
VRELNGSVSHVGTGNNIPKTRRVAILARADSDGERIDNAGLGIAKTHLMIRRGCAN